LYLLRKIGATKIGEIIDKFKASKATKLKEDYEKITKFILKDEFTLDEKINLKDIHEYRRGSKAVE